MSKTEHDYMFKIILIGSSGVGKSNILLRFTRNQFNQTHQTTIGVEYAAKNVTVNNKIIRLQIWDTMGQQQYKAIMKTFYKGTSAVILTYDITNEKSYTDLEYWYKQIKEYSKSEVVIMLVGNKSDMEAKRVITKQKGLQYAQKNKIAFYEVSAKDGTNIELIFTKIAEQLQKIMEESQKIKKQSSLANQKPSQQKTQSPSKESKPPAQNIKLTTKGQTQSEENKKNQKKCCK